MRIGILTQPLFTNYGGILQAYALQRVLHELGHEAVVVRFARQHLFGRRHGRLRRVGETFWNAGRLLLGRIPLDTLLSRRTEKFVRTHITPRTAPLTSTAGLVRACRKNHFEAYVVGSDQVWRPEYSPCLPHFFLDFAEGQSVRRIAYAASFGVDHWPLSPSETDRCGALLRRFDAISVREESAVALCRDHFAVDATQVLDPTLLLDAADYARLADEAHEPASAGQLFDCRLDPSPASDRILRTLAAATGLRPFATRPVRTLTKENIRRHPADCTFPPVTAWIRSFQDAELVLTDSFHGCVFAILFHKPFIVLGHEGRGMTRFHSLLNLFGLSDRLTDAKDTDKSVTLACRPIDWARVEAVRQAARGRSLHFIAQATRA